MFSLLRLSTLLCSLPFPRPRACAAIIRCLPPKSFLNPIIDGIWEDCGFEGPVPHIGDGASPIAVMSFDFSEHQTAEESRLWLNFLISDRASPTKGLFDRNDVKEITIKGSGDRKWFGQLPLIEHVFSKLGGLEIVRWESWEAIPEPILKYLEEMKNTVRLYYSFYSLSSVDSTIMTSPLLYSLHGKLDYTWAQYYEEMEFIS